MKRKALVVDLDGTLMDTNTFKDYIVYTSIIALKKARYDLALIFCFLVFARKVRIISHELMKKYILLFSKSMMKEKILSDFVDTLWPKLNGKVLDIVTKWLNTDSFVLLSTAAPESYASLIAKRLHLDGCCASQIPKRGFSWKENVRTVKCKNTLSYLGVNHVTLEVMLTDHYDDLPLLSVPKYKNIIVNPSAKTISYLRRNNIEFEVFKTK